MFIKTIISVLSFKKMKLLSFQPSSLYQNGGASRLLRRLYEGNENNICGMYISYDNKNQETGIIKEYDIKILFPHKQWMRWKLRNWFSYLRDNLSYNHTINKLIKKGQFIDYDTLHVINHGIYCNALTNYSVKNKKKIWVSFHDHFNTSGSNFNDTKQLWQQAERRLVISEELGKEYQKLFGSLDYELITDGVKTNEISTLQHKSDRKSIIIYFGGLLHFEYLPLFRTLIEALEVLSSLYTFNFIIRGVNTINYSGKIKIEYRDSFISDAEIKCELDEADILYLPIKFSDPDFYKYSLSTKMIGYLGASGNILYHGPSDSAAYNLLKKNNSCVACLSLNKYEMADALTECIKNNSYSKNAKKLAIDEFNLHKIQKTFWQAC